MKFWHHFDFQHQKNKESFLNNQCGYSGNQLLNQVFIHVIIFIDEITYSYKRVVRNIYVYSTYTGGVDWNSSI